MNFYTFGAPPRWTFDLFLNPRGQSGFVGNSQIANGFESSPGSSAYTRPVYDLAKVEGIQVPRLWTFGSPQKGGTVKSLVPLLQNMLNIRGLNTENSAHSGSQVSHQLPLSARHSVAAMTALGTAKPFAAVTLNFADLLLGGAADRVPVSAVALNDRNLVDALLRPFQKAKDDSPVKEASVRQRVQGVAAAFHETSKTNVPKHAILETSWKQANQMLERDIDALVSKWPALFDKYLGLTEAALDGQFVLPGVDDRPVMVGGTGMSPGLMPGVALPSGDARSLFIPGGTFKPSMSRAAAAFAMVEFLLVEDLTDSITVGLPSMEGLNLEDSPYKPTFDEHFCAAAPSVLINTRFHLAVASCLLELTAAVKATGKWNDTVIQLASEFGRAPRPGGDGSEHGPTATSVSIFSGQIEGPMILGDVLKSNGSSDHPGTWGEGGPVKIPGTTAAQVMNVGVVAPSLATLLGQPSPVTTFPSLLERDKDGKIVAKLPLGSLV